ncbi:DUF885 domain-containing protein [Acetobacteraceae bacterium]|nr:DUF885 domain-containing protein [Acetobacteraceae bacterium]
MKDFFMLKMPSNLFSLMASTSMALMLVGGVIFSNMAQAESRKAQKQLDAFAQIEKDYFQWHWLNSPVSATSDGVHTLEGRNLDALLDDSSAKADKKAIRQLKATCRALARLKIPADQKLREDDRQILLHDLEGQLLLLEKIQPQIHNPDSYTQIATASLDSLISRDFAPIEERMKDVIAREYAFKKFFQSAEKKLAKVPAIYLEISKEDLDGAESFVKNDVPLAFASVKDPVLQKQFKKSTETALKALAKYRQQIEKIKPSGSYILGRKNLEALLASDLTTTSIEDLIKKGEAQLKKDQASLHAAEKQISPKDPAKALSIVRKDHVAGDKLLDLAATQIKEAQSYVLSHKIATLPAETVPTVTPTLPFERSLITAAMGWPGAFETKATASYYYVTAPNPKDPEEKQKQDIEDLNTPTMLNITVHEAMPGHFVQGLYLHSHPEWSLTRKAGHSYATTEGWAHYTEQMMLDEGFHAAKPEYRLMVATDALLRDCRFLASLEMHTGKITLKQATDLMQNACYQSPSMAYKEARRGTVDPGYYSYLLGKLQIQDYRDAEKKRLGDKFSLQKFHDHILASGLIPISLIAQEK